LGGPGTRVPGPTFFTERAHVHATRRAHPLAWALVLFLAVAAGAHQPRFPAGHEGEDRDHALAVADITLSQVFYRSLTPEAPRFWLRFEAERDEPLFLQLGLPVLPRQAGFRPALALLGPGLPPVDLPFELPAGAGGLVLRAPAEPLARFHEPFSDTDSWILIERTIALPGAGRYHVVAYHPDGATGKLWVALGEREAEAPTR